MKVTAKILLTVEMEWEETPMTSCPGRELQETMASDIAFWVKEKLAETLDDPDVLPEDLPPPPTLVSVELIVPVPA